MTLGPDGTDIHLIGGDLEDGSRWGAVGIGPLTTEDRDRIEGLIKKYMAEHPDNDEAAPPLDP